MSSYLDLVNDARRECGISGNPLTTLGGTLSDESNRFKEWVNKGWREVQTARPNWRFMQRDFSFNTVAADFDYTAATLAPTPIIDFRNWKKDSMRLYRTAAGFADEQILPFLDYDTFRNLYRFGSNRTQQNRPVQFTVAPDNAFWLGQVPDGIYTVDGEYFCQAASMSIDTDVPIRLPEDFHVLITYRAMYHYALYESAAEVLERASANMNRMMCRLEQDMLPNVTFGCTLA